MVEDAIAKYQIEVTYGSIFRKRNKHGVGAVPGSGNR